MMERWQAGCGGGGSGSGHRDSRQEEKARGALLVRPG